MVDTNALPQIEIQTIVYDNSPGETWIDVLPNGESLVREKFIWSQPNSNPTRQGWDVQTEAWSNHVPWGAPNVAKSRRPVPHRVDAFENPTKQADEIKKLLKKVLEDKVRMHKGLDDNESDYRILLRQMETLQRTILGDAQKELDEVNTELSTIIQQVFPGYIIDFDPKSDEGIDKNISFFKADAQLLMGPEDGYLSTIERQGSGARRTLLWSALKYISESEDRAKIALNTNVRPHLLLLDEPEICLHPNAIREACNVLYNLPTHGNWQVMLTTHSPVFIDLSKDNTTIVRVEREQNGSIKGTTVYRPDQLALTDDDKLNLKLLNIYDPYVAEFFFGGKTIIVEGDTEYTALKYVIQAKPEQYRDIHIIRARGKATILSLMKILNHFGATYSILHDSDKPMTDGGRANPAWTINQSILETYRAKPNHVQVRLLASVTNFEKAYFNDEAKTDKPYNALRKLSDNPTFFATVEQLLKCLINHTVAPPSNCLEWSSMEQLSAAVVNINGAGS